MEGKRCRSNSKDALVLEVLVGNMNVKDLLPIINSGVPHSQHQSIVNRMAKTKGWELVALDLLDENSDLETLNLVVSSCPTPLGLKGASKLHQAFERIMANFWGFKWAFKVYQGVLLGYEERLKSSCWLRIYHQMAEEHPGSRADARVYKLAFDKADLVTQLKIIEAAKHHGVRLDICGSLLQLVNQGDISNAFKLLRAQGEVDSGIAKVIRLAPRHGPVLLAAVLEDPAYTNVLLQKTLRAVIQGCNSGCEELLCDQRLLSSIINVNCTDPIICKGVATAYANFKRPELAQMLEQQAVEPKK